MWILHKYFVRKNYKRIQGRISFSFQNNSQTVKNDFLEPEYQNKEKTKSFQMQKNALFNKPITFPISFSIFNNSQTIYLILFLLGVLLFSALNIYLKLRANSGKERERIFSFIVHKIMSFCSHYFAKSVVISPLTIVKSKGLFSVLIPFDLPTTY